MEHSKSYPTIVELMEFVIVERGRTADNRLADSKPVVCYFANEDDRSEFIRLMHEAKPTMVAKLIP